MTFEEFDSKYANGFDDAEITGLTVDYKNRTVTIHLNLRRNSPGSPTAHEYTKATLHLVRFYYLSVEPPDADHLHYPSQSKITVDGLSEDPTVFPPFAKLKEKLPVGAFCCRFYVHDWNSFIHVAAQNAEFFWSGDKFLSEDSVKK